MKSTTPPPLRWLIGVELARYRAEARLSMSKVSAITGMTKGKLANLEMGRQVQTEQDITRLLVTYGADQRSIARLTQLSRRADQANWWLPWADVVDPWFSIYVGLEGLADRIFVNEPYVIPGLLQTRAYAEAITAQSIMVRADHAQRVVDFRMARAARLTDPKRPLWLHAVINVQALDLAVGTPEVREKQLMHLAKMADLPTVTVQVLRPRDGIVPVKTGEFTLLSLDAMTRVGYVELIDDAVYLPEPGRIRTYELAAQEIQRAALDPEESLAEIRSRIVG